MTLGPDLDILVQYHRDIQLCVHRW